MTLANRHEHELMAASAAPELPDAGISEARLVESARHGDSAAFGGLVQRYERRLIRVIERFVNNHETARDLAQEAFLRAYQRLDRFDPSRRFGPWLFRVGVNLTLDHLRRRKRRVRWALFSEMGRETPPDPAVDDPRGSLDVRGEVRMVLSEMPENYRSVLVLRDLENFSTSEIAAILNRKEATIRWRLAEARNRFGELWNRRQNGATTAPIIAAAEASDTNVHETEWNDIAQGAGVGEDERTSSA